MTAWDAVAGRWEIACEICEEALDGELPVERGDLGDVGPGWLDDAPLCSSCADAERDDRGEDTRDFDIPRHGAGYGG